MNSAEMFEGLDGINRRPLVWGFYSAGELWGDDYTSGRMLEYHLNEDIDVSSRRGSFIDRSVEWMASFFRLGAGSKVIDFGCGPGLYASRLARKGAGVVGVDFSRRSVEYARGVAEAEGLAIEYVNENYLEYETDERFDLIIMIMCDFCALSPAQRKVMLGKFRTMLAEGGAVVLDVYSPAAFAKRKEEARYEKNLLEGFWAAEDYYGFLNTFKYDDEKVVLDKYTIVEPSRSRTIYNWLQYFSREMIESEFGDCGLTVEFFADVAGAQFDASADEFAVVARVSR